MGKGVLKDITGLQFTRLTALEVIGYDPKCRCALWLCQCECGSQSVVRGSALRSGRIKSCGCLKDEKSKERFTTHGGSYSKEYHIWWSMWGRCTQVNNAAYKYYGGRGIAVCERWADFSAFYSDMGDKPEGMSLDRVDNNKGYSPDNCRWATREQQMKNTRANRLVTIDGVTKTLSEWIEVYGVNRSTVRVRVHRGWDPISALTHPTSRAKNAEPS